MIEPLESREERLRELAVQATIHLSSVLRVAAVYDPREHVVQIQVDKLERTLREILQIVPSAKFTSFGSELYLNELRVPSRASQYKFIRTVLDEFARREMSGIRFSPGFDREELTLFLQEFLRSGVTGPALLDACRASGEGHVLPVTRDSAEGFDEAEEEVDPSYENPVESLDRTDPSPAARRRSAHAVRSARSLFQSVHMEDLEQRQAKRIVQSIVDATDSDEPVWVEPAALGPQDDFAAAHAVNVCSLAASMGRVLGLDRRMLSDLGVAALFHDIGLSAIADVDSSDAQDEAGVHGHCLAGVKLIARSTALSLTTMRCVRVALEHHLAPGPQETVAAMAEGAAHGQYPARAGFPQRLVGRPMSVLSQVVAVADTYVSFAMKPVEHGVPSPRAALGLALAQCRGQFEDALLWALVRVAGDGSARRRIEAPRAAA